MENKNINKMQNERLVWFLENLERVNAYDVFEKNLQVQVDDINEYCKEMNSKFTEIKFYNDEDNDRIIIEYAKKMYSFDYLFLQGNKYLLDFEVILKNIDDFDFSKIINEKTLVDEIYDRVIRYKKYKDDLLFFEDQFEISEYCKEFNEEFEKEEITLENNEENLYISFNSEKEKLYFTFEYRLFYTEDYEKYIIPDIKKILIGKRGDKMKTIFKKDDVEYVLDKFELERFRELFEEKEEVALEELVDNEFSEEAIVALLSKYNKRKYISLDVCFCKRNNSIDSILENVVYNLFVNEKDDEITEMKKAIFLEKLKKANSLFIYDLFIVIEENEFYSILEETENEVKKRVI